MPYPLRSSASAALPSAAVLRQHLRAPLQVILFAAVFALLSSLTARLGWHVSSAPLGFVLLLVALALRIVPIASVDDGARWLLAKSGLFLIPPVVAIAREWHLFEQHWFPLVAIIVGGTLLTTAATAFAVEWTCKAMQAREQQHVLAAAAMDGAQS